jgi:uncharacterized protein involved in exopolysaccharide biosynthesis
VSGWDMSNERAQSAMTRQGQGVVAPDQTSGRQSDGLFDLRAVLFLLGARWRTLGAITALVAGTLIAVAVLLPFSYVASAIVFVDPREMRVTLQEEVLSPIGTDAAVLESVVQIVKADGFLIELMKKLNLSDGASEWRADEAQVKALSDLRRKINIERMGATYLVRISYRGDNPDQAAKVANEIAAAFAEDQNGLRSGATVDASRALSDRLVELRTRLNASEETISRFKSDNNIVFLDERNTVKMRQLADLSQQMALVKTAAEEAEARYQEQVTNGTSSRSTTQTTDEGEQLAFLRRQHAQLMQSRAQQAQIFGSRHPTLVQTNQMIASIDAQIRQQRDVVNAQLRSEREVHIAKERQLAREIEALSADISTAEAAKVKLAALEREASADRDLYQQLLSRNKATNELAQQPSNNVRVVSPAVPPLSSSRPSMKLLLPVIFFFSFATAALTVCIANLPVLRASSAQSRTPEQQAEIREPHANIDAPRPASGASLLSIGLDEPQGVPSHGRHSSYPARSHRLG